MSRAAAIDLAALEADGRVVWRDDVIRFGDLDPNGHVNNAVFTVILESGRVHHLQQALGPAREPGSYYVLARFGIDFRAELLFPGRVRSGTWLSALGRTSMTFGQVLLDDQGHVAATAESVVVVMDADTRRPKPFGPAARVLAEPLVLPSPTAVHHTPHAEVPRAAGPRSTQDGGASFEAGPPASPDGPAPQDEDAGSSWPASEDAR